MSLTDPISDLLTCIRNALQARKETVDIPMSHMSEKIVALFKTSGYIEDFRVVKDTVQGTLKVYLKYTKEQKSAIIGLKRISKPGLRVYAKNTEIPRVLSGMGTAIISTSRGVISDKEARKQKIGGEVLCYIW